MDIAYCGITCTTTFNRISFPAFDTNFSFQPSNFELTIAIIQANISFLEQPQLDGIPKYFLVFSISGTLISELKFRLKF